MPDTLDALLPLPTVKTATGLSRATIYERVADGTFPAPFKLGRASRWSTAELREWFEAQRAIRDAGQRAKPARPPQLIKPERPREKSRRSAGPRRAK